ncbi:hypothetical protein ACLB2K_037617 [Fragaria x ananassa]
MSNFDPGSVQSDLWIFFWGLFIFLLNGYKTRTTAVVLKGIVKVPEFCFKGMASMSVANIIMRLKRKRAIEEEETKKRMKIVFGASVSIIALVIEWYHKTFFVKEPSRVRKGKERPRYRNRKGEERPRYRNRKGDISTNVLGVCTPDLKFIYVLPGWEGSGSDARVLRDALRRNNRLHVPRDKYFLVDACYTNGPGFLAPYRGTRYHLNEWTGNRPGNYKELYNLRHSIARNAIERSFGLLKKRWRIMRTPSFGLSSALRTSQALMLIKVITDNCNRI